MKKMKKILLAAVCFLLGASLSLAGTFAFLQDETETAYNVMTSGKVKIEQIELERNADKTAFVDFTKGKPADPAVYNAGNTEPIFADGVVDWTGIGSVGANALYADSIGNVVDHVVFVENTGKNAAYIRTVIAIEAPVGLDTNKIHINTNENGIAWETINNATINGVNYIVMVATYKDAVAGGKATAPSLLQLYLDPTTVNEDTALFGDTWDVLVISQAVQTTGFQTPVGVLPADHALDAAFGNITATNTPWSDKEVKIPYVANTVEELVELVARGGEIVLADDMELEDTLVIPTGVTVKLDLNGYTLGQTIEATDSYSMISNNGNLVITGDGKISLNDSGVNTGSDWGVYTIRNSGNLIVESGVIENVAPNSTGNVNNAIFSYSGNTTINGGEFNVPYSRTVRQWHGSLTINGGTFNGQVWVQAMSECSLIINGGTFAPGSEGNDMSAVFVTNASYDVDMSITGGVFTTKLGMSKAVKCVTGGTFGADPSAYVAEGYVAIEGTVYGRSATTTYTVLPINDEATFRAAMEKYDNIKLMGNITIEADKSINIEAGTTKVIDLNGYTISGADNTSANFGLINVGVGANLTVNDSVGTGSVVLYTTVESGWNRYSSVISNQRGTLTVNGGTIEHKGGTSMSYAIDNLTNGGTAEAKTVINGGNIKSTYIGIRQFCNGTDGLNILEINGGVISGVRRSVWMQNPNSKDNLGKLTITGGTLNGELTVDSAKFDVTVNGNILVKDTASLQDALKDGDNVTLTDDVTIDLETETSTAPYGNKVAVVHNGGTFDGNGNTVSLNTSADDHYVIMTNGGTIKNLTVDCGFRGVMIMNPTQDVILNNVISGGDVCYALNTGEGDGTHSLIATNCTFNGWSSIGTAVKDVTFTDCTFGQGEYYTNVYGRLVKPYVDTLFDGCEFGNKFYIDLSQLGKDGDGNVLDPDAKIVLRNCTVNGVKLTAENWTSLIVSELDCGDGQISIESKDGSYMTATNVLDYVVIE